MSQTIPVPIEVIEHHVHLSLADAKYLFGSEIKQKLPSKEVGTVSYPNGTTVSVAGTNGILHNLKVMEPFREETQVEISYSAAQQLGIEACLRDSGDLVGTPGAILIGGENSLEISRGVIIPNTHVHLNENDAQIMGLKTGDKVNIQVSGQKKIEYQDILVRVDAKTDSIVHLSFDDANAAIIKNGSKAILRPSQYPCYYDNEGNAVRLQGFDDIVVTLVDRANSPLALEAVNFCTNIFEFTYAEKRRMTANLLDLQRGSIDDFYFVVAHDMDRVVGVTSTYYLPEVKMAFMEFIAVAQDKQRKGLGSFMYHQTMNFLRVSNKELVAFVFEVRSTKDGLARRKEFFLNLGAVPIDLGFYPIAHKMDSELMLMIKPMTSNFCLNTPVLVRLFSSLAKRLIE